MGLLDDILKSALGGQATSGSQAGSLVKSVLDLLESDQEGERSGLDGLSRSFQKQGLGDVLSSWVGNGANRSISADQLTNVLGRGRIDELARSSGIPASQAPSILAAVLPALIDKLTPDGQVPQRALLAERGKGLLESLGSIFGKEKASAEPMQAAPKKADFSDVKGGASSTAKPPAAPAEEKYTVVAGDSLSKIAKRVYGNANDWRRIYDANRQVIGDNPDLIKPGQKLTIPPKA
jgi:uncharacterized protein YidB (DUF937 family)